MKLQALMDSGLNPAIRNRRALANHLTQAGDKITVHGVEGWFKHVDSNYAVERESLHPEHHSYAVPKRRWGSILSLFPVDVDALEMPDQDFRKHCFEHAKLRRRQSDKQLAPQETPLVFVLYSVEDSEDIYPNLLRLRESGFNLWWDTGLADDAQWSDTVASVIEKSSVCLYFQSESSLNSERCKRELELCGRLAKPVILSNLDGEPATAEENGIYTRLSYSADPAYQDSLTHHLNQVFEKSAEYSAAPATAARRVGDRPAIAVLPFVNLTGQQETNFIAQGITEDLITLLARIPQLFVISRGTTSAYAGILVDHRVIRDRLGARFALEGSVRRTGERLRVNAMFTDLESGQQVWADKFEGEFTDLWDVQDEITAAICARLEPTLTTQSLDYGSRTENYQTWRYWQLGWYKLFVEPTDNGIAEALQCFYKALDHEPEYALAHAGIANAIGTGLLWGGITPDQFPLARKHAEIAYRLLPNNPAVMYSMGMAAFVEPTPLTVTRDWVARAVELEPSNVAYVAALGYLTAQCGDAEEGMEICSRCSRLAPGDTRQPFINYMVSNTQIAAGEFERAVETMLLSDRLQSVDLVWIMTGFALYKQGKPDQARQAITRCMEVGARPLMLYHYAIHQRLWPQYSSDDKDAFLELCQTAGLH